MVLKVISGVEYQEYGQVFINGLDSKKRRSESMLSIGFVLETTTRRFTNTYYTRREVLKLLIVVVKNRHQ